MGHAETAHENQQLQRRIRAVDRSLKEYKRQAQKNMKALEAAGRTLEQKNQELRQIIAGHEALCNHLTEVAKERYGIIQRVKQANAHQGHCGYEHSTPYDGVCTCVMAEIFPEDKEESDDSEPELPKVPETGTGTSGTVEDGGTAE